MAGPLPPTEEGIVYADIDLNEAVPHYFIHDSTGHYWPKQFHIHFDAREMRPVHILREAESPIPPDSKAPREQEIKQEMPRTHLVMP